MVCVCVCVHGPSLKQEQDNKIGEREASSTREQTEAGGTAGVEEGAVFEKPSRTAQLSINLYNSIHNLELISSLF